MGRISGPLLDRFDLRVDVPPVSYRDLDLPPPAEGSAEVRDRISAARVRQDIRFSGVDGARVNADAEGTLLEEIAPLDADGKALLSRAAERFGLSARGYHRVLRVARTIADLAGADDIAQTHVAEAIGFRMNPAQIAMAA